jgi:chromosome segregation ATPase
MVHFQDRWLSPLSKYEEAAVATRKMRKHVIEELYSKVKVREIAIVPLSHDDIDGQMSHSAPEALDGRRKAIQSEESELSRWNDLLEAHGGSVATASNTVRTLEENIRLYDEAAEKSRDTGRNQFSLIYSLIGLEFVPLRSLYVVDGYLYPNMAQAQRTFSIIFRSF